MNNHNTIKKHIKVRSFSHRGTSYTSGSWWSLSYSKVRRPQLRLWYILCNAKKGSEKVNESIISPHIGSYLSRAAPGIKLIRAVLRRQGFRLMLFTHSPPRKNCHREKKVRIFLPSSQCHRSNMSKWKSKTFVIYYFYTILFIQQLMRNDQKSYCQSKQISYLYLNKLPRMTNLPMSFIDYRNPTYYAV